MSSTSASFRGDRALADPLGAALAVAAGAATVAEGGAGAVAEGPADADADEVACALAAGRSVTDVELPGETGTGTVTTTVGGGAAMGSRPFVVSEPRTNAPNVSTAAIAA